MIGEMLKVMGGALWLILKFILIIALSLGGVYSFGTLFMFPFFWEGASRLAISAGCVLGVFLLVRLGREKDEGPTEDDFRP